MDFLGFPLGEPDYHEPRSAWLGHGPFAIWLVHALRPRTIVELGTHHGFSYFCLCQGVAEAGLEARCFAVDTWWGDDHAGFYGEDIHSEVVARNARYAGFSTLLRKTFADALDDIADGSVDLLHVDGRHSYDDVKADFESWIPKLSARAVVLFHDTAVRDRGFGVRRYWAEIARTRPSVNFPHAHGLGVLAWGADIAPGLKPLLELMESPAGEQAAQAVFALAGAHSVVSANQQSVRAEAAGVAARLEGRIKEGDAEAQSLRGAVAHLSTALRDARRRPLKQFRRKLTSRLLGSAARLVERYSPRTAARFRRSAARRDPDRDELGSPPPANPVLGYPTVLSAWARQRSALAGALQALADRLDQGPVISVVVPVYNPDLAGLAAMANSVLAQRYRNWELCLCDDCSTDPAVGEFLRSLARRDRRVRVCFRDSNGHIARATNSAIDLAGGAFFAFLDHDDLLDPDALLLVAQEIDRHPDVKIIYSDEDKIAMDGRRYDPHFKPDWNRELLYGVNYVSHLGVYDAAMVREAGGLRPGFEGAQDYDLLLRCVARIGDHQIRHIPKVLYSWRASPGSAAASNTAKPYASDAGRRALEEHLSQVTGRPIAVAPGPFPFSYRALWPVIGNPLVSLIMPTRDRLDILRVAVDSILTRTAYRDFELIIIDNGSQESETLAWLAEAERRDGRIRIVRDERPFNYSALNNATVAMSRGAFVVLVNNDVEVITPDWLSEMLALAQRPGIGCVGARLLYPDGRVQHGGVLIGLGGVAGHSHLLRGRDDPGYFGRLALRQEYSAVTAACLLVRREIFDAVGGLNETELAVAFNDIDFCLKVGAAGFRNLWTPWAELYHHESASRGYEDTPERMARFAGETRYMQQRWNTASYRDPAYNPNLALDGDSFAMAAPRWDLPSDG